MESAITPKKGPGPLLGTIWWVLTVVIVAIVAYSIDSNVYRLLLGCRSAIALVGYLVMQIALWFAEFKWDESGSAAYLEVNIVKLSIWLWFLVNDCHYLMPHFSNLEKMKKKSVDSFPSFVLFVAKLIDTSTNFQGPGFTSFVLLFNQRKLK